MLYKRLLALCLALCLTVPAVLAEDGAQPKKHIKWVDFTVPAPLMKQALAWDVKNHKESGHGAAPAPQTAPDAGADASKAAGWIELLAYLGAKCGGDYKKKKPQALQKLISKLEDGETMESLSKGMKHYGYYLEAYTAVLGGLAGHYAVEEEKDGEKCWEERYGLRAFHPIARGFDYQHYDDFGNGRSYGYKRKHLGHDLMALTGTPVVAVESGTVEELGWNQYGGWRVGIRSLDAKRYYYYAHLRKNRPFAAGLAKGDTVQAGDVIGYVGRTGYSPRENTNGIKQSHLHFGIQLVFDESQKDGVNQIWIDPYEITKLLATHRGGVTRDPETKEYTRSVPYREAFAKEENRSVRLPVVMYHSIQKNKAKHGKYTISPDELEQDLQWLKENGYQSVTADEIIAFAERGKPLKKKPILLTFDDGYYDNVHYADPLLKKYGFTAMVFVVGEFIKKSEKEGCQNPNYSYSSSETLRKLAEEGVWEIESHSFALHHSRKGREGVKRAQGESDEKYYALLRNDFAQIGELIQGVTGRAPRVFAYPLGAMSREAEEVLKEMGYKITLSCTLGVGEVRAGEPDLLYKMKRVLRPSGKPLSQILQGETG
ncbi:MAG: polysaccharide deacetylase family protein [Oscillospiraceae bacterium]|jgi:peptidoglycan/xylan/chitin deacetylase (PgdA/CDA1 family)|nr:polysaccharide deacetylase family protein [Oscillospiraceae bacterium]